MKQKWIQLFYVEYVAIKQIADLLLDDNSDKTVLEILNKIKGEKFIGFEVLDRADISYISK